MKLNLICILMLSSVYAMSQQIGPTVWQSEADFKAQEILMAENVLWLEENPVATNQNDTKAITEFVLTWLTENPYLSVTLDDVFLENIVDNKKFKYGEKFRVTYLFGKAIYQIEYQDEVNETAASARGIVGMVKVYHELQKFDPSIRNRTLDRYAKLYKSSKLTDYVESTLYKSKPTL